MVTLEVRFLSDGRQVSLEEVAVIIAEHIVRKVAFATPNVSKTVSSNQQGTPVPEATNNVIPEAVGVQEAARLLSLSESSLRKLIGQKRLRAVHVGSRVLIPMETIRRVLQDGIPRSRLANS